MRQTRPAFTLMEVNLAILIMATGVLAMASLYSLGFRESLQSREDVAGTGYADAFLAPLVAGLSATNMTWNAWRQIGDQPSNDGEKVCDGVLPKTGNKTGWAVYVDKANDGQGSRTKAFQVLSTCNGTADRVYGDLMNAVPSAFKNSSSPPSDKPRFYALVATRRGGTISLAFRSSSRLEQLMSQPIYYAEVRFQGDPNL